MKKILGILFLFLAGGLLVFTIFKPQDNKKLSSPIGKAVNDPLPTASVSQEILFVPYWSMSPLAPGFSAYSYFAVKPLIDGKIDITDEGYKHLGSFITSSENTTLLTISLANNSITEKILQDPSISENVITDSMYLARKYHFSGVVVDVEYNGLAFQSVTDSITKFSKTFAHRIHENNLTYYQTIFGDTFYLARPYNVAEIAKEADGIVVMSYDFHKANGTPGPNFPLSKSLDSDYTFEQMAKDFLEKVPESKLYITFGMFGYDWTIDEKGRSVKPAESLSDLEITKKYLSNCQMKNCVNSRDKITSEPSVRYVDDKGQQHVVWYEDIQSVEEKEKLLQKKGIGKIGFWANGYY